MGEQVKGLRTLKSFDSLSEAEYRKWRASNAQYLPKNASLKQERDLFNADRFAGKYGADKVRMYTPAQRLAIEQEDLKQYNNSLIQKTAYDTFSPFREDGSIDPNKGVGDASTFWRIMNMDPIFQKELLESDWLTNPKIDAKIKEKQKERDSLYSSPEMLGNDAGSGAALAYFSWGRDAEEKIDRGANKNIFDKIYAKDLAQKNKQASTNIEEEYSKLNIPDEQVNQEFIRAINPTDKTKIGVPQLAAFFNEDGSIRSSEVQNLSIDDKKRWIAKVNAYSKMYDPGTVYDMLDKEAKDYINEHQDWVEYSSALLKDMFIGASAYTADKINGLRAAWLSFDNEKVKAYRDKNGRFWGREHVKDGVYTDPYSDEEIPVKEVEATKSALDAQGIAPDGTTRGLFFNNRYWSDAEATGMLDRRDQAKAKALNGYSPSKAVYKMGEDKDYIWEVAKMAQFAAADAISNLIPSLGVWGGAAMMSSKIANSAALFARELKDIGAALHYTSKAAQILTPTLGAVGIGHAYGRGVFGETLEGNMAMIDDYLNKGAEDRLHSLFTESDDKFSDKERIDRVSKRDAIKAEIENEVNKNLQKIGAERLSQLSEEERQKLTSSLIEEAKLKVTRKYVNDDVEQMRNSPEYDEKVNQAAESATSAALTAAWTTGIKYALVNNFGYRNYLFKDPLARVNSASSKLLRDAVENSSTGKMSIVEKFANASKRVKWKEVGKVTAAQMWGGGWTNFTDELQSAGARQMNADRMGAYLNDDYNASAQTDLLGSIGSALSYYKGMGSSLSDASTWNAGLVGALGSVTSVAPNMASLASGNFRSEWNKAKSWREQANLLISNGILNTYYDKVLGERQAKKAVNDFNELVDTYGDDMDAIKRTLALDKASMDATNPHDKDAIDFVKATRLAYMLSNFKDRGPEMFGLAKKSSIFNNALETVDKVTNGKFTEEEARDYLTEYYARNPSVAQSEENNAAAMEAIKNNAEKLKTGVEIYQKVDEAIKKVEESTGTTISPLVKDRLVERFALDQFLTDRIAEVEENISGNRNVTAGTVRESFGTDKSLNARISDIQSILEGVKKDISKAKIERDAREKKAKDYLESKKAESVADLTEAEQKEYGKLLAERDAAAIQVRALEEQKRGLTVEGDNLINLSQDKSERRVLSSEEILRLSPADRARMLDDRNFEDYSPEQQEQITRARADLALRDPQLLNDVQHQAFMVQRRAANAKAYEMMLNNPEAAAAELNSRDAIEYRKYIEALNRRRTNAMDVFIKGLEDAPSSNQTELEDILYNQLLGFGLNQTKELEMYRDSTNPRLQKYSHVFEKAINTLNMMSDVKSTINSLELSDVQQKGLRDTLGRMIVSSASQQELLDKIGSAIESPEVSAQDKALLNRALTNLEEIWGQKSATVTRGQQATDQTAEADAQEEARAKAAEDAARKAAEEASKPNISEKDADTSSDADAELAAHGLTKDDTKDDSNDIDAELAAHGLSKKDFTTDNESPLTPEQLADIARSKEGKVDLMESPTIEEQAAENPEKVEIRPVPKDDGTEQGNKTPKTSTNLIGNTFFRYYETIRDDGYERLRVGNNPKDPMNKVFEWLKDAGVNMQRIIDDELGDIAQTNPDIHIMYINPQNNATEDTRMQRHSILVVEYTPEVSRIHNDKNGGVFQANGKQYLMVGVLGYQKGNDKQRAMWVPVNEHRNSRVEYFKNNPGERFFVDQKYHTKIDRIGSGWLVRRLVTDNETKIRRISELLRDEDRNPKGLEAMDLKWYIQQGNDIATVNVSDRNKIHYDRDAAGNTGSVFLLVEGSNGEYIPAYINPIRYSEVKEGSKLKNRIEELFSELTSPDHKRRHDARQELRTLIVLKDGHNDINIGTEDKPKLSVFSEGVKVRTFNLNDAANDRNLMLQTLRNVDFRINVTTSVLSTQEMFDMYDEAGALTTDLAKLGTSNASFSVYAMDSDGNPIISTPVESNSTSSSSSDLSKSDRKNEHSVLINGKTYREWDGQWHDKNDNVITDERLIEQLHYNQIIKTRNLKPSITIGKDEVFVINNDKNNPVVIKRGAGTTFITPLTKEGALKMIDTINKEQVEQAKRERLKKQEEEEEKADQSILEAIELLSDEEKQSGAKRGERVDLGLEKHLTDQQLMDQMNGNFGDSNVTDNNETKAPELTAQQKLSMEIAERILSEADNIHLVGDHYVDESDGAELSRATTVIGADEQGSVFGLPKNYHTETIDGESFVSHTGRGVSTYYWKSSDKLMVAEISNSRLNDITASDIKGESVEIKNVSTDSTEGEINDYLSGKENPWTLPSTTLGTGVHNFIEDILLNKAGNPESYADRYPNMTNDELKALATEAEQLRDRIKNKYDIVGTEVSIRGTVEVKDPKSNKKKILDVGGTIDVLLRNKETGKFAIYDFKTKRSAISESDKTKWSLQQSLYKRILENRHGAVVESIEIVPAALMDTKTGRNGRLGKYPAPLGKGGTTEYTEENGQLYANGVKYDSASVTIGDNIPLSVSTLNIQYRRLPANIQSRVRTIEDSKPSETPKENKEAKKERIQAQERLRSIEKAMTSPTVTLWSSNPKDNVGVSFTSNGFNMVTKDSRLSFTMGDFRDALNTKYGETTRSGAVVKYKGRSGETYVEMKSDDGQVKSAIIFPTGGRGNDNVTLYFYRNLEASERNFVIENVKEDFNRKNLEKYVDNLLNHFNDDLAVALPYVTHPERLEELRRKAYSDSTSIVESAPVKTNEDINKTGSKSLAELQANKSLDTALAIMKSKEYGSRVRELLKKKFPDMPSKVSELEGFLASKEITVTGIKDPEQWIKMIEECKK